MRKPHGASIIYSRKYYPPPPNVIYNNILGLYDYDTEQIKLFLPAFRKVHGKDETKHLVDEYIRIITHEFIHGVIGAVLLADKWSGHISLEYPLYNGMDHDYTRVYNRNKKNIKTKKGARLFG